MKITLSRAEFTDILSKHFGMLVEDFSIKKGGQSVLAKNLTELIGSNYGLNNPNKIQSIKNLREFYLNQTSKSMGLADAKGAIEQFPKYLDFVSKYNRFPKEGHGYADNFDLK